MQENENQIQLKCEECHWVAKPARFLCKITGNSFTMRLLILPSKITRAFDLTSVAKMHWAIF